MKWNSLRKIIAGDVKAFVDDLRASGHDEEHAWQVARMICAGLQRLGIQDAPRKRRPPARVTGAWAGTIFSTVNGEISICVSQEKWNKAKEMIEELLVQFQGTASETFPMLKYKRLEQIRGFWCHLCMTYPIFTCYLKGMHLVLAAHWPGRDEEGWRIPEEKYIAYVHEKVENGDMSSEVGHKLLNPDEGCDVLPPNEVRGTSRLLSDLKALRCLVTQSKPPPSIQRSS